MTMQANTDESLSSLDKRYFNTESIFFVCYDQENQNVF